MKTNKEIFIDKLNISSMNEFVNLINTFGIVLDMNKHNH